MTARRRLSLSAFLALFLHLTAGIAMAAILRRGLQTNPDLNDRLLFLAGHRALWTFGWLTWTAAGASILLFYACFAAAHSSSRLYWWTVLGLALSALTCDWAAQYLEVVILPGLTGTTPLFLSTHRAAVLLTGGAANGFYTLDAALLVWLGRDAYPAWVSTGGAGTVLFGTALTLVSAADSTAGLLLANAGLVPFLLVWLYGTAVTAWRREN